MKYRKLRIAWSVAWGLVAVLLCVLWVRSYIAHDLVHGNGTASYFILRSERGLCMFTAVPNLSALTSFDEWEYDSDTDVALENSRWRPHFTYNPIGTVAVVPSVEIVVPAWMAALLFAAVAAVPWLRFRFSLRTLLNATTLVALLLGLFVWLR